MCIYFIWSDLLAQNNWEWQMPLPQGNRLVKILQLRRDKIISTGDVGTILVTEDSGKNWVLKRLPGHSNIRGISFINSNTGWIINKEMIFQTDD